MLREYSPAMNLRELFTEKPYGAVLSHENLRIRCSTCFAAKIAHSCKRVCERVFYCSEQCRDSDHDIHEFECAAFKKLGSAEIDSFVRLLARILTRRRIDCGVAHLSQNFPKNIPDRRLSDLISHRSDIEQSDYRAKNLVSTMEEFRKLFNDTPLMENGDFAVTMYCVMMINCFSISGDPDIKKGHQSSLGLGFYLNTSRFNHSCCPDLSVRFDDCLLVMQYQSKTDDDLKAVDERLSICKSASKFNRLTLNYGYAHSFSSDSFFPSRNARRTSLEFGYYFRCRCVLCSDDRRAELEENAAALECAQCAEPCLWRKTNRPRLACCLPSLEPKFVCRKSCRCSWDSDEVDDAKTYARSLEPQTAVAKLEEEWNSVMSVRISHTKAEDLVTLCEPLLNKARYFWHRSGNLRMAHLNERLFIACGTIVVSAWKQKEPVDQHLLKMALETGEGVMAWCKRRPPNPSYHTVLAAYAYRLARLYSIRNNPEEHDRLSRSKWYLYAATIWKDHGKRTSEFVAALTELAAADGSSNQ